MVPQYAINGSLGEVRDENGKWIANAQEVTGKIVIDKKEIMMSGSRSVGYKAGAVRGDGTLRMLKVTSEWILKVSEIMRDPAQPQFIGQLLYKLEDPDSLGVERVLLKNVQFWEVGFGWKLDELVEDEIPFTFTDIEFLDVIDPNADFVTYVNKYKPLPYPGSK